MEKNGNKLLSRKLKSNSKNLSTASNSSKHEVSKNNSENQNTIQYSLNNDNGEILRKEEALISYIEKDLKNRNKAVSDVKLEERYMHMLKLYRIKQNENLEFFIKEEFSEKEYYNLFDICEFLKCFCNFDKEQLEFTSDNSLDEYLLETNKYLENNSYYYEKMILINNVMTLFEIYFKYSKNKGLKKAYAFMLEIEDRLERITIKENFTYLRKIPYISKEKPILITGKKKVVNTSNYLNLKWVVKAQEALNMISNSSRSHIFTRYNGDLIESNKPHIGSENLQNNLKNKVYKNFDEFAKDIYNMLRCLENYWQDKRAKIKSHIDKYYCNTKNDILQNIDL